MGGLEEQSASAGLRGNQQAQEGNHTDAEGGNLSGGGAHSIASGVT